MPAGANPLVCRPGATGAGMSTQPPGITRSQAWADHRLDAQPGPTSRKEREKWGKLGLSVDVFRGGGRCGSAACVLEFWADSQDVDYPAMAAGLSDHICSLEEVGLLAN